MSCRDQRGYTLFEILIVLVISGLVISALLMGLIALLRAMQPQAVTIQGTTLPIAPNFGAFPSAVRLHQSLTDRVSAARAIYVLGGRHITIPANAPEAQVQPLTMMGLPSITDFSAGLPLDAKSFYDLYATKLGAQATNSNPEDFSLIVVGPSNGGLAVTFFAQVQHIDVSVSDGTVTTPFIERNVQAWDIENGASQYEFVDRPALAAQTFIGAVHTWMRYQMNSVAEEGPTCVVFPDPWLYAGARAVGTNIPPFSRFSYFFPVSQ